MSRFFYHPQSIRTSIGLLLLRVIVGSLMATHGYVKYKGGGMFHWAGDSIPAPLQFLALLSELGGGLALVFGLLTPLAALGIVSTMLVAIFTAHWNDPIMMTGKGGAKEPALLFLAPALLLVFSGAGVLSLDKIVFGRRDRL